MTNPTNPTNLPWMIGLLCAGLLSLTGCDQLDPEMLARCEPVVPGLEAAGAQIEIGSHGTIGEGGNILAINYRVKDKLRAWEEHWLACHFSGGGLLEGELKLEAMVTDRLGKVSPVRMFLLKRYWLNSDQQPS